MEGGKFFAAVLELDAALQLCDSPHARWNRAMSLLALGRYAEGWEDYRARWELFGPRLTTARGAYLRQVLPAWDGAPLAGEASRSQGKRLVVIHESGFGDTIMLLRLLPRLRARIDNVALVMPPELERLGMQFAPLLDEEGERDVHCCMFDMPRLLGVTVDTVPCGPYIEPNPWLQSKWDRRLGHLRWKIGVAWSTTRIAPWRTIDPAALRAWLNRGFPGHEAVSLQNHDREGAEANGIRAFEFQDFADVVACASLMDSVVSIDTAALHAAAASGHQDVTALLPEVRCWRWQCGSPWYPGIKLESLSAAAAARSEAVVAG
jgi:hypothetical protein